MLLSAIRVFLTPNTGIWVCYNHHVAHVIISCLRIVITHCMIGDFHASLVC